MYTQILIALLLAGMAYAQEPKRIALTEESTIPIHLAIYILSDMETQS
jgi:hypothetical protein